MQRLIGIIAIAGLLIFGGYKIFHGRVVWTDPKSVSTAFLSALKTQNLDKAKKYYVPAEADEWKTNVEHKLYEMQSHAIETFQESIPDEPVYTAVASAKGSTDTTLKAGDIQISLRQIEGSWYVSKSPY